MEANWTTTKVACWQIDCENFRKGACAFELLDVSSEDHWQFVKAFSARNDMICHVHGTAVVFEPRCRGGA